MTSFTLDVHDRYATITINRPERRNALTPEIAQELIGALRTAEADATLRAVVITGAGTVFCAGADLAFLSELATGPAEDIAMRVYKYFQGVVRTIVDLEIPVIAAVNGPALGAGCDLALSCDCRIVGPDAVFEETWVKLGAIPGMGAMSLLPRIVGLGRARSMLYRAEPIDAATSLAIGLAEAGSGSTPLGEFTEDWLAPLVRMDRAALTVMKRGTRHSVLDKLEYDLLYASSHQASRMTDGVVRERIKKLAQRS